MSADRLREAARVLRERAEAATDGTTWYAERTENGAVTVYTDDDESVYEDEHANLNDARYIATMHPGVGLALADWLEETRCAYHCDGDGRRWPYCSACEDSTEDHECPDRVVCTHSLSMQRALAIADLILGAES